MSAWLYDGSGDDTQIQLDEIAGGELPEHQLLWIDSDSSEVETITAVFKRLGIKTSILSRLLMPQAPLQLDNYGEYFSLTILAIVKEAKPTRPIKATRVTFLIGKSWLVSIHDGPVEFIDGFREQDKGDTNIGLLSPPLLLGALLDWHLSAYLVQVSHIESEADRLDEAILGGVETRTLLAKLVNVRMRISKLRQLLADQRSAIYGLSRPDILLLMGVDTAPQMEQIAERFDRAIDEVERSRDVIIGSFDLFTSLTAQKTNELVKALTYVTVVIGLCSAVAGLLGMNFDIPFFKTGMSGFLSVVAGLAVMIILTFGWAKWRKWF